MNLKVAFHMLLQKDLQRRQEGSSMPERPPSLMVLGIPVLAQKPNNALGDFDSFSFPLL